MHILFYVQPLIIKFLFVVYLITPKLALAMDWLEGFDKEVKELGERISKKQSDFKMRFSILCNQQDCNQMLNANMKTELRSSLRMHVFKHRVEEVQQIEKYVVTNYVSGFVYHVICPECKQSIKTTKEYPLISLRRNLISHIAAKHNSELNEQIDKHIEENMIDNDKCADASPSSTKKRKKI